MCRPSIRTVRFVPPAVLNFSLVVVCCATQLLAAEESIDQRNTHNLSLFMSAKEQRDVEQELRDLKDSQHTAEDMTPSQSMSDQTAVDTQELVADGSEGGVEALAKTHNSGRYDGAVLKGDKVLGVWFDGKRYSDTHLDAGIRSAEVRVENVYADGQIEISGKDGRYKLFVGELIPGQLIQNADSVMEGTNGVGSE